MTDDTSKASDYSKDDDSLSAPPLVVLQIVAPDKEDDETRESSLNEELERERVEW